MDKYTAKIESVPLILQLTYGKLLVDYNSACKRELLIDVEHDETSTIFYYKEQNKALTDSAQLLRNVRLSV